MVRPAERRVRRGRPRDGRRAQDRVVRDGPHTVQAFCGRLDCAVWDAIIWSNWLECRLVA